VQAHAYLHGRDIAVSEDVFALQCVLKWNCGPRPTPFVTRGSIDPFFNTWNVDPLVRPFEGHLASEYPCLFA
jgi:hypothetical protein